MPWWSKLLTAVLVMLASFAGGFYYGKGEREVVTITKKGETHTVFKDRIVTVTRIIRPDGTVEETTKTEEKEGSKDTKNTEKDTKSKPILADYSVGAKYWAGKGRDIDSYLRNTEVMVGRRMIGDIWLEAGVLPVDMQLSLGVSFKF